MKILKSSAGAKLLELGNNLRFPLIKNLPCLKTERGKYVMQMENLGLYGLIFPQTIPDVYLNVFETQIGDTCVIRDHNPSKLEAKKTETPTTQTTTQPVVVNVLDPKSSAITSPPSTTTTTAQPTTTVPEKISSGIQTGTSYLITGIEKSAEWIGQGMNK